MARKAAFLSSGDEYARQGKLAEAILEYRNAVQAVPSDGPARLALAEAYLKHGEAVQAVREYVRAADLLPERIDVQLTAGQLLLLARQFDDAKLRAEKALERDPKNVQCQLLLANALAGLNDLERAIDEIEEAIGLDPTRATSYTTLGTVEIQRGRTDAAEQAFKRAIELDPALASARLALGHFFWATGNTTEAESALKHAVALQPDNVVARRAIANFYLSTKRPEDAETHLKKVLELTNSSTAALALADFYLWNRQDGRAVEVLQRLTGSRQLLPEARVRLAALDHAAGRRDVAYAQIEEVLARDKTNLQALLVKATMLLTDGRKDDAFAPAELAVRSHRESAAAFHTMGAVQSARRQIDAAVAAYEEVLRLNPRATVARVALAQLHLAAGRAQTSVGFAEEAVRSEPTNPAARLVLVRGLIARGEVERARAELERLETRFPDSPAVLVQKGILLARRQESAAARRHFEAALKLQPGTVDAVGGLVALDIAAKDYSGAKRRIDEHIQRPDVSSDMLMLAGRTYFATGDRGGAEQFFRRILDADPSYLNAYGALAELYVAERRLDAALTEFETLAARHPRPVAPLTFAGIILLSQGKMNDARSRFERVIQLDKSAPVAANNLAWIYAESGENLDVALQLAQTAKQGLPESPEVSHTLGTIYYKKSLYSSAIPALQFSAGKDPSNALYHFHLGLALAKNGNASQATRALERALSLKSDFAGANEAREILKSLVGRG